MNGDQGTVSAAEFVQSTARALWLTMSNYKTIRSNIQGALADHEYELAAMQARFGLQIGIRAIIAQRRLSHIEGSPFEVLRKAFAETDPVRVLAFQLDRRNPKTPSEVADYCRACHDFVETTCGVSVANFTDAPTRDGEIEAAISTMEDLTELAGHLSVNLPWPPEDVTVLRLLRGKLADAKRAE